MGTLHSLDKGMSCHSTSIELFYFNDNFCRIALWVSAFIDIKRGTGRANPKSGTEKEFDM